MVSSNRGVGCSRSLGVFWAASCPLDESCSHAEEAGYQWVHVLIYSCGSDFEDFFQKYVYSLFICISRYLLIC